MHSKQQYNSLLYNPQEKPRRPQTPLGNNNHISSSQANFNRSYSKNMAMSPHYSHGQNMYGKGHHISKSRVSVNSSASQLQFLNADGGEIFPEDLIFLLKNEEKNINNFKQKIEKEKTRVQNDFSILKTEIQHVLEDLKLSFQAQLDLVYKTFITKYAQVKGEVQQIRRMRKQILMANNVTSSHIGSHKDTSSNIDIVSQIEKDAEHFRNYRVYSYLTEMQKQKITPILQLCSEIILIGSADCPFYRSKQMSTKSKQIKSIFSSALSEVFERIHEYVVSPQIIVQKQKQQQENANNILNAFDQQNLHNHMQQNQQHKNIFDIQYPQNRQSPPKLQNQHQIKRSRPASHAHRDDFQQSNIIGSTQSKVNIVSSSQKLATTKWAEQVSLKKISRVVTDHQDAILCLFIIQNRYIATGSKDKTINIYTFQGKKVTTLRGHDASICTLSTINSSQGMTYLASGSDHGCCCLILWDTRSWTISSRIQSHTAAVTCIVDLGDGENLITGSYDKHINLFNYRKGQVVSSHNNKSNVTSIIVTSDKRKLISAGLQNSIIIWDIIRSNNGIILEMQKTVQNDSLICILEPSILRPEIVYGGTRNGKIKVFNLGKDARVQKTYTVNQNSIIQLAIIQRQMKNQSPIVLSCSSKDKSLCMTKMDTGLSQHIRVNGAFNIQFGCGIGPKIVMSNKNTGIMAILSQSSNAKQFSLFDLELK